MVTTTTRPQEAAGDVRVWDPVVRCFHWSLVAAFFIAYFTEDDLIAVHVWAGYAVGGIVLLRILWGFVGTRHARFSDFLFGPFAALRYLRALAVFRAPRHLGHSPAGGFMIYLLLAGCLLIVATGLITYGAHGHGPLSGYVQTFTPANVPGIVSPARAHESEHEEGAEEGGKNRSGRLYKEVHETLANIVLVLVILHVGGVLLASLAHRENLIRSMVTGRKRAE